MMMQKVNVYLAGPRGFCAGVDRAILMVEEALMDKWKGLANNDINIIIYTWHFT